MIPEKSRMDGNLGIRKSKFQPNFYKKNVLREVPLDDWSVNVWIDISVCEKEILKLGRKFVNRMDSGLLEAALQYVDFGENALAFETLCDHILEYDIPISDEEYRTVLKLAAVMT